MTVMNGFGLARMKTTTNCSAESGPDVLRHRLILTVTELLESVRRVEVRTNRLVKVLE